jgi:hypothetical protein
MKRWILICGLLPVVIAIDTFAVDPPASETTEAEPGRLQEMQARIDALELTTLGADPRRLRRSDHAILRYTNPATAAVSQGATFLWLDGKRPLAAISLSYRAEGKVWWELASLSDGPLELKQKDAVVWEPIASSRKFQAFHDAPAPAAMPSARLTQMRELARRFTVKESRRDQWQDGRLLTQPLYRWSEEERGTVDGAVFGFAETTDPELLLIIEARRAKSASSAEWHFALGKMSSAPMIVSLGGQEIFNVPGYWSGPRTTTDPYVERLIDTYEVK